MSNETKKKVAKALEIQALIKPLEEKLKALKEEIKDVAQKEGVKDEKGNYVLENGVGRAVITTVIKIDNEHAVPYLKALNRTDLIKTVETTTAEQLKQIMGEEDIATNGLGSYTYACRLTATKKED